MSDQAATLRVIRGGAGSSSTKIPKVVQRRAFAVAGGKGGVGKSTVALNLALAYAQANHRTLVLDTDLGMADLNLMLGVAPDKSMLDALGGTAIEDIIVKAHGIELLPALNGSYVLSTLGSAALDQILKMVASLAENFDTLVVDVAAGIGRAQTKFAGATTDTIVVVNPEPLSMADAYASLKVLSNEQGVKHAFVAPNRISTRSQADEVFNRLRSIVDRFLPLELTQLPHIPADPSVAESAQIGVPLMVHAPDSPAARAIRALVRSLATLPPPSRAGWWRDVPATAQGDVR